MSRYTRNKVCCLLLLVCALAFNGAAVLSQDELTAWDVWAALDVNLLDDDNTGSTFATREVAGVSMLMIEPGGGSDETKLAYPVSGADLQAWADADQILLHVYLPGDNALNANTFFLGLADVSGAWTLIGCVFGTARGASDWLTVRFVLEPVMRALDPDGEYMFYLSFFHERGGSKIPLTEPFYLGAVHLVSGGAESRGDERYQGEVDALLGMDEDQLIDAVARETFDYFWLEANPDNGLVKDRSTPNAASSIAATGFGLAAIPIAIDRGWIEHDDGYQRALMTLQTFVDGGVQGERGFFFHFVDIKTGERVWDSELSSIDTALLVAGALVAGQYFEGTDVQRLADQLYEAVEWDWMLSGGSLLKMGWTPERGFLSASWDHFDESLLLYVLAIGSPTHPIPVAAWDLWDRPVNVSGEYIYLPGEPLFVYQYPLAFLDLRDMEDQYANYWNNAARACERNRQFALDHSERFITYRNGVWGISASDGPSGYRAYGAASGNHNGTVAPYASIACLPFTPEIALDGMRALLSTYGARVWREYGFVSAINEYENWYSREHIGIDQGDILLMIANAQDGFVWDLFMANPHVLAALDAMGFVESSGDYAVTPAYLSEVTGQ